MSKKIIGILLCIVIIIICVSPAYVSAFEETINKYALPAVTIGGMVMEYYSPTMATGVVNGHNYFYTCARGGSGVFNVSDIDDGKLVATYRIPQFYAWEMLVDSEGMVWMTGNGKLVKYDPYSDNLINYGVVFPGEIFSTGLCKDDNDNIYIGTYPNAKIIKFDREIESFVDLGIIHAGASYVRSLAYCNGYIYAGTFGATSRKFIRINKNDYSDKKEIKMENSYISADNIDWIYYMSSAGDLVFCTLWMKNSSNQNRPAEMIIYDTTSETFLDYNFNNKTGGGVSQAYNGKVYFYAENGSIKSIDLATKTIQYTGVWCNLLVSPNSKMITLNDTSKYPNPVLVLQWDMRPLLVDIIGNKQTLIPVQREGSYMTLSNLTTVDDKVLVSADASKEGATYDINTGEKKSITLGGQAEAFLRVGNKMYVGGYPGGYLYCTDLDTGKNVNLGHIADNQSRPFAMTYGDNKIFMGTMPEYGELGGVIAQYDLTTGIMNSVRNVIPNQSIINLIYRDGLLYGTSAIYGGAGSNPTETNAKIFIYNPATQTLIKSFTPNVTGMSTIPSIRGLIFDNNGNLWAAAGKNVFMVNPETEGISHLISFGTGTDTNSVPYGMRVTEDNHLYININGVKIVNLVDYTYKDLSEYTKDTMSMTIGSDGNIYFISSFYTPDLDTSYVKMIPILDFEVTKENLEFARKLVRDTNYFGLSYDGLLNISNEELANICVAKNLSENEISYVKVYIKYYLKEDNMDNETLKGNAIGSNVVEINNRCFDNENGWTSVGTTSANGSVGITDEQSYDGDKSLKIFENANQQVGAISDYIPVDSEKTYQLNYREMINSGRLYLDIEYYDNNKTLLDRKTIVNIISKDRWSLINTEVSTSLNTKYIKLCFNKPYYLKGEGYIDSVSLFESGTSPKISSLDKVFTKSGELMVNGKTITGVMGLVFAKVIEGNKDYNIKEYGVVISKIDSDPEIGKASCIKASAITAKNIYGQYGILFYGNGIVTDQTYYTKAYLIYERNSSLYTIYGQTVSFNVAGIKEWLNKNDLTGAPITVYEP